MAKHYVLVDEHGNKARFVGEHLGQNAYGDDYYVQWTDDVCTLLHVDNRDGSWMTFDRQTEGDVIRRLAADGEQRLADRITAALEPAG